VPRSSCAPWRAFPHTRGGLESHTMPAPRGSRAPPCSTIVRIGMLKSIAPLPRRSRSRRSTGRAGPLQFRDDLHRANLRRARHRATGNAARNKSNASAPSTSSRSPSRRDGAPSDAIRARRVSGHAPTPTDRLSQVVAEQIHDHDVLGAVLLALQQLARQHGVLGRRRSARTGPLIGRASAARVVASSRRNRSGELLATEPWRTPDRAPNGAGIAGGSRRYSASAEPANGA